MTPPDDTKPAADRRRSPRYELSGATILVRGQELPIHDISVLGLRTQGRAVKADTGAVVALELRIPRTAPAAPPRRFALIASVTAHDERGLVLRWLQPSARWARAFADHLAAVARLARN
ncbi:MAG: hypothetical protein C6Y20_15565 [Tagaea sp. CACIAM 22H2]|jgi:hypothetical protein|nr:hypothetical protein [Tagaea sp. CACIAM 22H2]